MSAQTVGSEDVEIDEAEEEALLRSDDEGDSIGRVKIRRQQGTTTVDPPGDEDSLMEEEADLDADLAEEEAQEEQDSVPPSDEDTNDDDDDDLEDMDEDDRVLLAYQTTLKELETNQYDYNKYVRLCELAHTTTDLENIRSAYNAFAAVYPLSSELWLKYLAIEANVAQSPKEVENLLALFQRAMRDYYSTDLALAYAALAPRSADPAAIWEEVLCTYALPCLRGREVFKKYRAFIGAEEALSAEEKQERTIQSYLRELRLPLYNMEETYIEFKVFYERNKTQIPTEIDWKDIDKHYYKAKDHLQLILPFEQELTEIDAKSFRERADVYGRYIKAGDARLDENVLQTVYERMVTDCCLNPECWLTYINFVHYRDEFAQPEDLQGHLPVFKQTTIELSTRALRNCTWSEKLYINRIHLFELNGRTREEVQEILENSMTAGFQTPEPVVAIWFEYLTYLRRHTDFKDDAECDILRKNFGLAWTILGQQWGVLADCNCEILQFWGRLEYGPMENPRRGKELWTTVMESADNATKSGLWVEFIELEARHDHESARRLYASALAKPNLDDVAVIATAWERFERCNGSIKTLKAALGTCEAARRLCKEQVTASPAKQAKRGERTKSAPKRKPAAEAPASEEPPVPIKKAKAAVERREQVFKEHESQEIDLTKDHLRVFLSNLDYNLTEEELRSGLPELDIVKVDFIRSANGRSRGFGYLELASAGEVAKALAIDRRSLNGRPLFVSSVLRDKEKRQKFKYSDGVEPQKLFVKGLPPDVTKEELETIFGEYGPLRDVRMVYHKSGTFKNIAYVEFANASGASKAVLAVDQTQLRDCTLSVAISAPPPKTQAGAALPASLGAIGKKRPNAMEQRPRMSLIPNVVRRQFAGGAEPPPSTTSAAATNGAPSKTNADFRKLLLK